MAKRQYTTTPGPRHSKDKPLTKRELFIAVKWLQDDMTTGEAVKQLKSPQVHLAVYKIAIALRQAVRSGLLQTVLSLESQ